MKYVRQLIIILFITFLGEALHALVPLPVPGGIYGLVLMLAALCTGLVKLEQVKDVSSFLLGIMPVLFVPACAGIIGAWDYLLPRLPAFLAILAASYFATFAASGITAQKLGKGGGE